VLFKSLGRDSRIQDSLGGDHRDAVSNAFERAEKFSRVDKTCGVSPHRSAESGTHQSKRFLNSDSSQLFGVDAKYQVLSSDLSAASDLLPLDLVEALVEGFLDGSGMSV
jgi:hypothetical protein